MLASAIPASNRSRQVIEYLQIAAAVYLAAGIGALLGLVLPAPQIGRGAVFVLALGTLLHALAFASLHGLDPMPSLTSLSMAVSLMAWMTVLALLVLMWRVRLPGLVAAVGPLAFLAVFVSALRAPSTSPLREGSEGSLAHAHVLLASAGLALLAMAGVAGVFFLVEHRRLKARRPARSVVKLPSLEALDRVNRVALAIGFPLLSLGVLTGALWLQSSKGRPWQGSEHEIWTMVAWGIYAGLAAARFAGRQAGRQAAASAVAGFAFLLFAVVGVGMFT
jgi:ABC-type transport system involved in cytochrome c biogenesis permease subunit